MSDELLANSQTPNVAPGGELDGSLSLGRSVGSASVYAAAAAAQRGLTFLLLPLYARVLSPAEYGRVGLLASISALAYAVLGTGFDLAVIRQYFYYDGDVAARARFVSSAWLFQMAAAFGLGLFLALAVLLFGPASAVFRPVEVATAIMTTAVLVVATIVPMSVLRAEQRLKNYVLLTAVSGIANAVFTVGFVAVAHWGVTGWLLGTLCANALALVVALFVIEWSPRQARDYESVRRTLAIGLPLVPQTVAGLSLQLGDRILLSGFVSAPELGIYSLGANLALPALILIQSLNQGFMPAYARLQHRPDDTGELRATITIQVVIVAWVGVATSLVGPPIVTIVAPAAYGTASAVIPWITLGYVFYGLFVVPTNGLAFILGRTKFLWVMAAGAAVVNLGMVYVLAGLYGIEGAAAASAIGYGTLFIVVAIYARRSGVRFSIDWPVITRASVLAVITYVAGSTMLAPRGLGGLASRAALTAVLIMGLAAAAGLSSHLPLRWLHVRGGRLLHGSRLLRGLATAFDGAWLPWPRAGSASRSRRVPDKRHKTRAGDRRHAATHRGRRRRQRLRIRVRFVGAVISAAVSIGVAAYFLSGREGAAYHRAADGAPLVIPKLPQPAVRGVQRQTTDARAVLLG